MAMPAKQRRIAASPSNVYIRRSNPKIAESTQWDHDDQRMDRRHE
jgi:hypothetical protein